MKNKLENSIRKVEGWVEENHYIGYEPFDGLLSFFRPLTFGNLFLDRILLQIVRQSPFNLRPFLGIKPQESTIGRGYMAWGYLTTYKITGIKRYADKAEACLAWLIKNKSPGYSNYSWGKHFDFASRSGIYKKFEPIIVWTSLIGQAFLDAYEVLEDKKYLEVAVSICDWIMELPREQTDSGACLSYLAYQQSSIHNSNMLGAVMLARTSKMVGDSRYLETAKESMKYSCTRQLPDGSWYYGESPENHWIDNFHTGYNLESLKCYIECTGDTEFAENMKRGLRFYKLHFFEENGRPKYYHDRTYPVDSQCASQSIQTLANFSDLDGSSLELSIKVARWTIDNMQDPKGYFYYRQYPLVKAKTPMLHWGQATTYKALSVLLSKM